MYSSRHVGNASEQKVGLKSHAGRNGQGRQGMLLSPLLLVPQYVCGERGAGTAHSSSLHPGRVPGIPLAAAGGRGVLCYFVRAGGR